ncbi:PREDICTED: uncharacterized protein LOC109169291 isoform X4 [Ipomoea nil]|uniref:uncharacterized protein LOC109169291 isoform X4 n=1 Tax=Ipomoea nil TaxID=35883 RepID=UPI000900A8A4|nr:PREDICTED: uncharacterized protein LOC109169291 isoform X4 [Ipomoea nil]
MRLAFTRDILEKWNIQFFVIASLLFQMILLFLAPLRKWVNNGFMYLVIWGVYLLASFFSTFALSLIYNHAQAQEVMNKFEFINFTRRTTYPLWAPFLLVHLGGPHTITALAMEDNNLWHRHLLTQVVQVLSVLIVFYKYRIFQSEWLLPTAIVFLVGIAKCVERIFSLHLASSNFVRKSIRLQDSPPPPAAAAAADDNINSLDEYEIIRRGYEFYQTFKGFIIDHTFIHDECGTMKEWFSKLSEKDAFKVMEAELNFMYQAMFTKMIAVQYLEKNFFWCIWWFGSHALLVTVAVIFFNQPNKHRYLGHVDIGVTYCLLGGAILIEAIALIHLIFGHWTIFKIMNSGCYKNNKVVKNTILPLINCGMKLISQKKSWSGKVIQYSLVKHSLTGQRWKWAEPKLELFSLKELIDSLLHTQTAEVGDRLKKLVVDNIKRKAADDINNNNSQDVMAIILPLFKDHTDDDYATFVLTLHVATDICYFATEKREGDDEEEEEEEDAKLCIQISHYLAYFLVLEGKITSALPGSIGMRFRDVCWKQVRHTFDHLYSTFNAAATRTGRIWCWKRTSRQKACEDLLSDEYCEVMISTRYENSVLPKAVEVARKMKRRCSADPEAGKQKEFWKGLSEVWVGLLVYASSHCRGDIYYLNKGGQFCTFVRLLMAHFGLQDSLKGERSFNLHNQIHSSG